MALLRPDEYKHNNDNYAIIDSKNARGALFHVDSVEERDAIPLDKRSLNHYINIAGDLYHYTGADVLDATWTDSVNWKESFEKLKRLVFVETNTDLLAAFALKGEVLCVLVGTDSFSMYGNYPIAASRVTIVGNISMRISYDAGVIISNTTNGAFCLLNINVPILLDVPTGGEDDASITYSSTTSKVLIMECNYVGTYPENYLDTTLTLNRSNSGSFQFNWSNVYPGISIIANAGTSSSYKILGEGPFIQDITSDYNIITQGTGTERGRWSINPPKNLYKAEWFDPSAFSAVETWVPATEIDATHDYAIMPKFIQNSKTGTIFHFFAACSGHNIFSNRIPVFRKSVDGGVTWTNLSGGTSPSYTEIDFFGDGTSTVDIAGGGSTQTGRIIVFFRRFANGTILENQYSSYSDDEGLTWSTPYDHGYSVSYVFDNKFCIGQKGEIMIATGYGSAGASARHQKVIQSFDNGETWTDRSIIYNPQISGYTFGECMMRDFGDGLFVAICRNANDTVSSGTFTGMDLPMLFVSRDYGMTWADGVETVTQAQLNAGEVNSGWLPLEGTAVDLGDGIYQNCLPLLERVDYKGHKYMLILYYLRDEITLDAVTRDELLRLTAIKLDEWLVKGWKSIKEGVAITVYEADDTSSNQSDGNGMMLVAGNRPEIIWTICDNLTTSQDGAEVIRSGRIDRSTIEALLDSLETATSIS